MRVQTTLLTIVLALLLASCGGSEADVADPEATTTTIVTGETTSPPNENTEPARLLVMAETGGCFMMGPNCATTLLMSDGTFGVFRADPGDVLEVPEDISAADFTGQFDVTALTEMVAGTDFDALLSQLGPGECRACFDGIDISLRIETPSGPLDVLSTDHDFDGNVDFFREIALLQEAIGAAGELETQLRGG